jgi:hypothetical protein
MVRRLKPLSVSIALLLLIVGCVPTGGATVPTQEIKIIAVDSSNHSELQGARVFVLGETGQELATARTDERGRATLSVPMSPDRPKYVFVAHPHYFISGTKWLGAGEYYILASLLEVR